MLSGGDWCCQEVIGVVRRGLVMSGGDLIVDELVLLEGDV